jgi:hypothetical protein
MSLIFSSAKVINSVAIADLITERNWCKFWPNQYDWPNNIPSIHEASCSRVNDGDQDFLNAS